MKILIAVDDAPCSISAFRSVLASKWTREPEFDVVTVVEPIVATYAAPIGCVDALVDMQLKQAQCAEEFNLQCVKELKDKFPQSKVSSYVAPGSPAEIILEHAEKSNPELIVLGSHGRKGFSKLFMGSVAERVAARARCSVEIVKTQSA